jgi:hypothetical protein
MGATVLTGTLAAAFKTEKGNIVYALFEQTYEKNCYPHTPNWSCRFIGSLQGAVEWIFAVASSFEGGMLQRRNGGGRAETYIREMLAHLKAPIDLKGTRVRLANGKHWTNAFNDENRPKAIEVLRSIGEADMAAKVESGLTLNLSLEAHGETLVAIINKGGVSPYHVLDGVPMGGVMRPELGYDPTPVKAMDVAPPAFLFVGDSDTRLRQRPDGSWYAAGWQYRVVADYIEDYAATELKEPGNYARRIKAYREACAKAPLIPKGTKVVVDRRVDLGETWRARFVDEFAHNNPVTITEIGFEVEVPHNDPHGDLIYRIAQLPVACTTWVFPRGSEPSAPAPSDQLSLLPAA